MKYFSGMISYMKRYTFIAITLLAAACQSKKAAAFRDSIMQQEQRAADILIRKNSPNEEKLDRMIKHDFDGALVAIGKEETAFNAIIKNINALPTEDIKAAGELKTAAAKYYMLLRDLEGFDRQEIAHRMITSSAGQPDSSIKKAQDKMLELSREKLRMYDSVHAQENVLYQAIAAFNKANGLK